MNRHDPMAYSRFVGWMKIILPLSALALLSTIFLVSRGTNIEATLPFSEAEIEDRLKSQQITNPSFSGVTDKNDVISLKAQTVLPQSSANGKTLASGVSARIEQSNGRVINITSGQAELDVPANKVELTGGVRLFSDDGFEITTGTLETTLKDIDISSKSLINATSPIGNLNAGRMAINRDNLNGQVQMLFTEGVKVIYTPKSLR